MATYRAVVAPQQTADSEIVTFQDVVDHALESSKNLDRATARDLKLARKAVLAAYRDFKAMHSWSHYQRRMQVLTEAKYVTGTVTYDHTGGAYERMLTITGGTWPANAARGLVLIASVRYDIDERKSSTIITLPEDSNPGADLAAGTTYSWFRQTYPLPARFSRAGKVFEFANNRPLDYRSPTEFLEAILGNYSPAQPWMYTFRNDGEHYGNMSIELGPPPDTVRMYEFMADVKPRAMAIEKYAPSGITVTVSGGATTATFSGGTLPLNCAGAVLRVSDDGTNEPTAPWGVEPYLAQRIIQTRDSATTCTFDQALPAAVSAVKFTISDPVDIESGPMLSCFEHLCEAELMRLIDAKEYQIRYKTFLQSLVLAMGEDAKDKDMSSLQWITEGSGNLGDYAIIN
jgi:hypothetical protein